MAPFPPQKTDSKKGTDSLFVCYVVSVLASWNAELVTYPLDLVKTRLQIQGEQAGKTVAEGKLGQAPHRGMIRTAYGIAQEEGVLKLWHGMTAIFARHLLYSGTRMILYKKLKEEVFLNSKDMYFPIWQSALCGITAGSFAQYISSPAELVKVQLQMEGKRRLLGLPPRVHGMVDAFKKVWEVGGVKGLWKGSLPNVYRAALVNLGDLSTYDVSKRFILRNTTLPDNVLVHALASTCAGFVAALMGTPADVIKSRVMNQPFDEQGRGVLYKSMGDCVMKTVKLEGLGALYKGFIPLWIRLAPWALTFWLSYEQIVRLIGAESW